MAGSRNGPPGARRERPASAPRGETPPVVRTALLAALAVTGWRVKVLLTDAAARSAGEIDGAELMLRLAAATLGLAFVAAGAVAVTASRGTATRLFAAWTLTAGLHWGGPLLLGDGTPRVALIVVYVVLSGALSHALLLHLALAWPSPVETLRTGAVRAALYLPPAAVLATGVALVLAPRGSHASARLQEALFGLEATVADLLVAAAVVTFVARALRASPRRAGQATVAAAAVIAYLPAAAGLLVEAAAGAGGPDPRVLALAHALLPAVLAHRLVRDARSPETGADDPG